MFDDAGIFLELLSLPKVLCNTNSLLTKGAPKIDEYVKNILSKYRLCILATHLINRLNLIDSIGKSNGHAASLQAPHGNDYFTNDILLPYLDFRNCPF